MRAFGKTHPLERLFHALADRTRLRLLHLMAEREVCVCHFVEVLQAPQPKISRHLAHLRRAGLVTARRDGKWIHYRLARPADAHAAQVLQSTLEALHLDRSMQRDQTHLQKACCELDGLLRLAGTAKS